MPRKQRKKKENRLKEKLVIGKEEVKRSEYRIYNCLSRKDVLYYRQQEI